MNAEQEIARQRLLSIVLVAFFWIILIIIVVILAMECYQDEDQNKLPPELKKDFDLKAL